MKKILTYAACLAIAFTSCSKDSFENAIPSGYKEQGEHIQDVFGVKFDPNHTWSSTTTGQVTINGKREVTGVTLSPEVVDPDDIEMLQDLVVAAVNEALRQVEDASANVYGKLAGGLGGLGGLGGGLPF